MKEFKIRASAVTDIMAEPRLKSETISEGAKTYCKKWLKEELFGRRYFFTSKYTNKGLETEEEALNLLVRVLKLPMVYLLSKKLKLMYQQLKARCSNTQEAKLSLTQEIQVHPN